jgi:hypothetical protein
MEKRKMTKDDLQKTTQNAKDREARTPLKPGCGLNCTGRVAVPAPLVLLLSDTNII